jgi:transposase
MEDVWVDLAVGQRRCEVCGKPFEVLGGSEDSEQVEVAVRAYRRRYRRRRYRPTCGCAHLPAVVAAPPPPKLIPKGLYGVSVWVTVLLDKYAFLRPLGRLVADLATQGLVLSPGTVTDGLRRLAPLFEPLVDGLVERNLAETQWHADETTWHVFEPVEGKVGSTWWLWVFRSASAAVFVLDPSRSARVPEAHLQGAEEGILIVDRYVAYKRLTVVKAGQVLLAFCWQHVRRDFLEVARDWPGHEEWGLGWVARIGEMLHLNRLRVEVLDTYAAFAPRDAALRSAIAAMAAARDAELAQPDLHPARRRALDSLRVHWEGLSRFVDNPWIPTDNSEAERRLRGPAVARKVFYGSVALWAGHLAAALFSLFATLDLWGLNPRRWLTAYLEACAANGGKPPPDAASFLPWNLSEARRRELAARPPPDT